MIIGIIYGILALLYFGTATINQMDAIKTLATVGGKMAPFWCALVLLAAVWPIALIMDTIIWISVHK